MFCKLELIKNNQVKNSLELDAALVMDRIDFVLLNESVFVGVLGPFVSIFQFFLPSIHRKFQKSESLPRDNHF
jgi:hypothetical protein